MKLSISNIAWSADQDSIVYEIMKENGFSGLEIAPTRIFPERPYEDLGAAERWAKDLKAQYGFAVPSMQSIWYGVKEQIFGSPEERSTLIDYTKKAIEFAEAVGCGNLVFGCPRNRNLPEETDKKAAGQIAEDFFRELADHAVRHNTVIAMEANPPIYHTNYINTTVQALELTAAIGSDGFKVNLDTGTIIENGESLSMLEGKVSVLNHVHISEPGLKMIERRELHRELAELLQKENYQGYVSIETGRTECMADLKEICAYVKEIFG